MAEDKPQNYGNHAMFDPWFHIVLFLGVLTALGLVATLHYRQRDLLTAWALLLQLLFIILMFKTRIYAMKVQDRVIRLEERLRLERLLPEPLSARIPDLTIDQLIGLRFAGDGEVAGLVEQTLAGNWNRKQIKQAIKDWRADHWRV